MSTTKRAKPLLPLEPWKPCAYEPEDAYALRALQAGTATDHQQRRALKWIIETACATYDQPYRPGSARDTDFACGMQHVGKQIVKLLNMKLERAAGTSSKPPT